MRPVSAKRLARIEEARPTRTALLAKFQECMVCGASPRKPHRNMHREMSATCVHEIANGPLRAKALDKPFACLVTCCYCNLHRVVNKREWPEARQLAVLLVRAPENYNLPAYLQLTRPNAPNRITQEEVEQWIPSVVSFRCS